VQVSKSAVIGVVGAMVVMIGVIAFLLGRESGRHRAALPAPAPGVVVVGPGGVAAPAAPLPASPQLPGAAPSGFAAQPTPLAPPPLPTAAPRPGAPLSESKDETAQVHDYFLRVAELQAGPAGDPNEFANQLITAQISGDSSGFDELIKTGDAALAKAQALPVPAACSDYHQQLVKLLGDSMAMLRTLKSGLARKDANALTAILPAANALQSQTTALESTGRQLKARFGL